MSLKEIQVIAGVKALLDLSSKGKTGNDIIQEVDNVFVNFTLENVPRDHASAPYRLTLPFDVYTPDVEICLIVTDKSLVDTAIRSGAFPQIREVITLEELKKRYSTFESKRKLCARYDLFVAEDKIVTLLPPLLGSAFFKTRKLPIKARLSNFNLETMSRILRTTTLTIPTGTNMSVKVGTANMDANFIVANIMEAVKLSLPRIFEKVQSVTSIRIKTSKSLSLPISYGISKGSETISEPLPTLAKTLTVNVPGINGLGKKKAKKAAKLASTAFPPKVESAHENTEMSKELETAPGKRDRESGSVDEVQSTSPKKVCTKDLPKAPKIDSAGVKAAKANSPKTKASKAKVVEAKAEVSEVKAVEVKSPKTKASKAKVVEAKAEVAEVNTAEVKSPKTKASKAKAVETEVEVAEVKAAEVKSPKTKASKAKAVETEAEVAEVNTAEMKSPKTKASKAKAVETEAEVAEVKAAEVKSPKTKASKAKAVETEAEVAEVKAAEMKSSKTKASKAKVVEAEAGVSDVEASAANNTPISTPVRATRARASKETSEDTPIRTTRTRALKETSEDTPIRTTRTRAAKETSEDTPIRTTRTRAAKETSEDTPIRTTRTRATKTTLETPNPPPSAKRAKVDSKTPEKKAPVAGRVTRSRRATS